MVFKVCYLCYSFPFYVSFGLKSEKKTRFVFKGY